MEIIAKYSHILISIVLCIVFGLFNPYLCFIPWAFYFGREHAQAESRYIKAMPGNRADYPWYIGFYGEAWNKKGMMDWVYPMIVSIIFFLLFYFTKIDYFWVWNLITGWF